MQTSGGKSGPEGITRGVTCSSVTDGSPIALAAQPMFIYKKIRYILKQ